MAVKPSEIKDDFELELELFEKQLDDKIRQTKMFGRTVKFTGPSDITERHWTELQKRYRSAGWKSATRVSDTIYLSKD